MNTASPDSASPSPSPPVLSPERLEQARVAYVQMKTCTILAFLFAAFGVVVFAIIYSKHIAPDVVDALRDFSTIGVVIMPFLPSLVLTWCAKRFEKRYLAFMKPE